MFQIKKYLIFIVTTILVGLLILAVVPKYISFRELSHRLKPNVFKIMYDKKITESDLDTLLSVTHKYTYDESHGCIQDGDEEICDPILPTKNELISYYIKKGYPGSEWHYQQEKILKENLESKLKNDSYYYDRYIQEQNKIFIFFNSRNDKNKTIMLEIVSLGEIQEIDTIMTGETDIFKANY